MKGVAIVSGGMDSVTMAYFLKRNLHPEVDLRLVSFDYGQRHVKELQTAIMCAERLQAEHDVINLQMLTKHLAVSGSVLVDQTKEIPHGHYAEESMKSTVVPNRNAIMLSIATGIAVADGAEFVAYGVHGGDHFIYPDCRPLFFTAFDQAMKAGNEGFAVESFRVMAPFIHQTKADIVHIGETVGVPWVETWSCYEGGRHHCGQCGTCVERREAFSLAGVVDPTTYSS